MTDPNDKVPTLRAEQIGRLEAIINYIFRQHDKGYLWEALQVIAPCQARVTHIGRRIFPGDNSKPALVGDGVMAVAFLGPWFSREDSTPGWSLKLCPLHD
jgi:hypothetical protein